LKVLHDGFETEFVDIRECMAKNRGIAFPAESKRAHSGECPERIRHFKSEGREKRSPQIEQRKTRRDV
jgi:hypothetical protein